MRRETSGGQTSDWQCAGKRIPLLTTGNIVQGDFGAPREMTVRHAICLFFRHTEASCEEMISFFTASL